MKNIRSIRKCITKAAAGIAAGLLCCQSITAFAAGSVVTTDHVRIRKGPSLNAEIITVLNPGTELPLISQPDAEWDEVQFNGSSAYIARQFVSERAAAETAAKPSETAQAAQPAQAAAEIIAKAPVFHGGVCRDDVTVIVGKVTLSNLSNSTNEAAPAPVKEGQIVVNNP